LGPGSRERAKRSDEDADALEIDAVLPLQLGRGERLEGRRYRVLDEDVHLASELLLNPLRGFKVANFAGDLRRELLGIEARDLANARLSRPNAIPVLVNPDAHGAD
jgi:hypothetical protein